MDIKIRHHYIKMSKNKLITTYSTAYLKVNYAFQIGHLRFRLVSIDKLFPHPQWYVAKHYHTYYEIHIIASGKGTVIIEDETFKVKKGNVFITGPRINHTQITDPNDPMQEYCLKLYIEATDDFFLSDEVQKQETEDIVQALSQTYKYPFLDIYNLKSMMDELYKEVDEKKPAYTINFQSKVIEMIVSTYRMVCDENAHINPYNLRKYNNNKERSNKILKFICENYTNDITIQDIEQYMNLSGKQINRILKINFNQTFSEYLTFLRLQKVKQLTEETSFSTEQIASMCGFSNIRSLYRILKKNNILTPAQMRKNEKNHNCEE